MTDMRYDGFISYSHAADGRLAPALQKALQKLAKPWFRRRSLEIFRDETGLSVDPHLWGAIVRALDDSEWFLLLVSPQAAQSEWVGREIEHWKTNRSLDRILPVLTDGHWEWDEATGDFTPDSDAVPPALHGVFTDEPRHLDLRWARDEQQVDLNNSRFRNAVAEIAAPLHGVSKDEIEGEDVRQHRRTVRIAWSAAATLAVLTVAAVVAGGVAVVNAHRAEERRILAESQRLANYSQAEPTTSELAFLLAAQAYRMGANPLTETALFRSVTERPAEIKQRIPIDGSVSAVAISTVADRVWLGTSQGGIITYALSDGREVARMDDAFKDGVSAMARLGNDQIVASDGIAIKIIGGTLDQPLTLRSPGSVTSLAIDASTGRIGAGSIKGDVFVWTDQLDPTTVITAAANGPNSSHLGVAALTWTSDGGLIVADHDGGVRRFDPAVPGPPIWEQIVAREPGQWVSAVTVLEDGTVVTGDTAGFVEFRSASDGLATVEVSQAEQSGAVTGLAATGDQSENGSVASVGADGYLVFFNHLTGKTVLTPLRVGDVADSVAWDAADPLYGVTGEQGSATLLDYSSDRLPPVARQVQGWSNVVAVAMSPSGDRLAVARRQGSKAQPETEIVLTTPADPNPNDPSVRIDGNVQQLTFSADGSTALASTGAGTVAAWDGIAANATATEVAPPGETVAQLAVSPDGATVATGSLSTDETDINASAPIRLWRLDGLKLVQTGQADLDTYGFGLAFSPDGRHLVVGGVKSPVSPDSKDPVTGGTNAVAIYPLDGGETVYIRLRDDMARSLAIAPDGKTVAVGLWSGPVEFFDIRTGKPTGDELRQSERATAIAFRDNNVLVTVSADGSFKLWDLVSLRSLSGRTLSAVSTAGSSGAATSSSLGLGRDTAVTASLVDGRLITWSLNPAEWIAQGCKDHQRELTDSEKSRFGLEGSAPVCPTG